jgi:hypothetical protein
LVDQHRADFQCFGDLRLSATLFDKSDQSHRAAI